MEDLMKFCFWRNLTASVLATGVLAFLAGCGGGDSSDNTPPTPPSALIGTWAFSTAKINVQGLEIPVTPELIEQYVGGKVTATIMFDADNTWTVELTTPAIQGLTPGGKTVVEGTWSTQGQNLTLNVTTVQAPSGAPSLIQQGASRTVTYSINGTTLVLPFSPGIVVNNLPSSPLFPGNSLTLTELDFTKQG
jgi:hypothetical protein